MFTRDDVINAGFLDRMVERFSNIGSGQIDRANKEYLQSVIDIRDGTPFDIKGGWGVFREIAEEARLAVNRARRLEKAHGKAPPVNSLNDAASRTGQTATTIEYTVIVEYVDLATGGTARFPVHVQSADRLDYTQIISLAAAAGQLTQNWRDSGARGEIHPSGSQFASSIIIGIVGR